MSKRILNNDLYVTPYPSGIEIVTWIDGYRIRQFYSGYNLRDAKREFKALVKQETNGRYA